MEKGGIQLPTSVSLNVAESRKKRSAAWRNALLALVLFLALNSGTRLLRPSQWFRGSDTTSLSGIAWSSCPDLTEFDCAYLTVPLDYINPLPNETVSLALRRLPASAPVKDRKGTLFINPGGPGGSGTNAVARNGPALNIILQGRYDILSWDPRGINMTTPALGCYPTDWDEYMQDGKQALLGFPYEVRHAAGGGNTSAAAELAYFERVEAYFAASAASCDRNGNQKMLSAVSTAFVARDMVSILEALGEAERGINYWGFSYGTILGATFSSMFPDLVYRVVLDGVSDSVSFTRDIFKHGQSSMTDTNKVWAGFLTACADAGPEACSLARPNSTASEIEGRIDALLEMLADHPIPVAYTGMNSGIVTASHAQAAIFQSLYAPRGWPRVAKALSDLEAGDGSAMADLTGISDPAAFSRRHPDDNVFKRHMTRLPGGVAGAAVLCSDTDRDAVRRGASPEALMAYTHGLEKLSITGGRWAQFVGRCGSWKPTAIEAYRGPWTVKEGLKKTKFPVVFLGNTADPVTPLAAARSMSAGFGNASATLLIQDGFGHCSTAHPSLCTARVLQKYFFDGEVPEYGKTCVSDKGFLFPKEGFAAQRMEGLSEEDRKLMHALDTLSEGVIQWW